MLSTMLPSRNWMVPVAAEFTVALKVTDWPVTEGLRLDVSDILVVNFTASDSTGEYEPPLLFVSPL